MGAGNGGSGGRSGFRTDACGAIGFGFELDRVGGGEKVGVEKFAAEEIGDEVESLGRNQVFGDVALGVSPDEGKVWSGFEGDRTDENILQGGVRGRRGGFAEGEFDERSLGQGGGQQLKKAGASGNDGHPATLRTAGRLGHLKQRRSNVTPRVGLRTCAGVFFRSRRHRRKAR